VAVGRERLDAARESRGGRAGEAWDGREAVADIGQPLEDGAKQGAPGRGPVFIRGNSLWIAEGGEKIIGCLVSNVVAESKVGIGAGRNADEALVGLDLANSAPGEPLDTGFKVGPQDVPFSLARDRGLLLQMVDASKRGSRVGVQDRTLCGRTGGVLHGDGETRELSKEASLGALVWSEVPDAEVSAMVRQAVEKGNSDASGYSKWGVRAVAAAVGEPGGGCGEVNIVGGFFKGDGALVQVGNKEGWRVKGGDRGAGGRRNSPRKNGAKQGAREGDAVIGSRACRNTVQNGIGFIAERAERRDLWVHAMGTLVREQGIGETLHQETAVGRAKRFIHAVEG
jgi:hypothetical protein